MSVGIDTFPHVHNRRSRHSRCWRRPHSIAGRGVGGPRLRFSVHAWAKLVNVRSLGESEVGFFGVAPADDLLFVQHLALLRQTCTRFSTTFDDVDVAHYFEEQAQLGRTPEQVGRIWVHLHRGRSAAPSDTDERTFARVFGRSHWSVMCIVADSGATYARLQFCVGPRAALELPVTIDWTKPFADTMGDAWAEEYFQKVEVQ